MYVHFRLVASRQWMLKSLVRWERTQQPNNRCPSCQPVDDRRQWMLKSFDDEIVRNKPRADCRSYQTVDVRRLWSLLNSFRTGQGLCADNLHLWVFVSTRSVNADYDRRWRTLSRIVTSPDYKADWEHSKVLTKQPSYGLIRQANARRRRCPPLVDVEEYPSCRDYTQQANNRLTVMSACRWLQTVDVEEFRRWEW